MLAIRRLICVKVWGCSTDFKQNSHKNLLTETSIEFIGCYFCMNRFELPTNYDNICAAIKKFAFLSTRLCNGDRGGSDFTKSSFWCNLALQIFIWHYLSSNKTCALKKVTKKIINRVHIPLLISLYCYFLKCSLNLFVSI